MVEVLFDSTTGLAGMVQWLGEASDGMFFIMAVISLFIISFVPTMMKWGVDWPLLASALGTLLFAIPIYYMQGFGIGIQADIVMFILIMILVLSIVKIAVFKDG